MNEKIKYPCRNCAYYNACGDSDMAEPCKGRVVKTETKKPAAKKATTTETKKDKATAK